MSYEEATVYGCLVSCHQITGNEGHVFRKSQGGMLFKLTQNDHFDFNLRSQWTRRVETVNEELLILKNSCQSYL